MTVSKRITAYFTLLVGIGVIFCNALPAPNLSKTKVWGPGLKPENIVLPARYFFIHTVGDDGKRYTSSLPGAFDIQINGTSKFGDCRSTINQINRGDGSVIVRYKVMDVCRNVEIHIRYHGKTVARSPYKIKTDIRSDSCSCPMEMDYWLELNECPTYEKQIQEDLIPFRAVNFTNVRDKILQKHNSPGSVSLCNYVIRNNEIFRECFGQYTGFKMFMDAVLVSIVRKVKLPDTEFFINLGDWPLVKKGGQSRTTGPYPIFSWCGSDETFDIVLPTYDITESTLENMGRVTLDMLSVQQTGDGRLWNEKIDKAFWRGRDSRRERLNLIDIGRANPDLFNVSLTNFFFFRDEEATYGPKAAHISFMDFFQYKYQINIDGTVAAYRFPYLLAGNSLVLKQESPFYEHFYKELKPNVHYVPFKRDLSDLVEKIKWAQTHGPQVQKIIQNAQRFTRDRLLPRSIYCYHVLLLKKWSENLVGDIRIQPKMERVPVPNNDCDCNHHKLHLKDEL